jgi:nucleoside-diphosphate-sugar epimerase
MFKSTTNINNWCFGFSWKSSISLFNENISNEISSVSTRYKPNETHLVEAIKPIPSDKFFQCDITDRTKLFQIIEEQKIDFIIHLAAVLEMHPDIQKISDVNINGTKNIFEARQLSFT